MRRREERMADGIIPDLAPEVCALPLGFQSLRVTRQFSLISLLLILFLVGLLSISLRVKGFSVPDLPLYLPFVVISKLFSVTLCDPDFKKKAISVTLTFVFPKLNQSYNTIYSSTFGKTSAFCSAVVVFQWGFFSERTEKKTSTLLLSTQINTTAEVCKTKFIYSFGLPIIPYHAYASNLTLTAIPESFIVQLFQGEIHPRTLFIIPYMY